MAIGDKLFIADKPTLDRVDTNIGSDEVPASASGSVHGKLKELRNHVTDILNAGLYTKQVTQSSSTILTTSNSLSVNGEDGIVDYYSFAILIPGVFRLAVELRSGDSRDRATVHVYVNGVMVTEFNNDNDRENWATYTKDISFGAGDFVRIAVSGGASSRRVYIRNFSVLGSLASSPEVGVAT